MVPCADPKMRQEMLGYDLRRYDKQHIPNIWNTNNINTKLSNANHKGCVQKK